MQRSLLWCGYAGSSLEVKIETEGIDAMEIKTEVDSNDIAECLHGNLPSMGLFCVSFTLSTFVCLCITCTEFALLVSCCCCVYYE